MRGEVPGLRRDAGRGRGDHRGDPPGGEGGRNVPGLDLGRNRPHQLRQALGRGVIGAERRALQILGRVDRILRVDALARPRHREEQRQALGGKLFLDQRARGLPQGAALVVAGGQEGNRVDREDRILVRKPRHQHLADGRQAAAHGILDLGMRVERPGRVHGDLQPAIGRGGHVLGELLDVLGVEHAVAIGRGHVPVRGGGGQRKRGGREGAGQAAE